MSYREGFVPAKLHRVQDQTLSHPYYVGITNGFMKSLLIPEDKISDYSIAVLCQPDFTLKKKPKLFVFTEILENIEENSCIMNLYVTQEFLIHYNFKNNIEVMFKYVYCLPLQKIIIGTKNKSCFEYLKTEKWITKLQLLVCQKKILCRTGDVLLVPPRHFDTEYLDYFFDISILECYPVSQGIIDIKTEIIIVKTENNKLPSNKSVVDINQNDPKAIFNLLNYMGKLILYRNPQALKYTKPSNVFKINIIPKLPDWTDFQTEDEIVDPLNTIFISKECMEKLKISEKSWIKVKIQYSEGDVNFFNVSLNRNNQLDENAGDEKFRMVSVLYMERLSINEDSKIDNVFISPLLWFNLNEHPSTFLQEKTQLMIELSFLKATVPPWAEEINCALVQSPDIDTTIDANILLKTYFQIPRYLMEGDIIAISSRVDVLFHQKFEVSSNVRWPMVYFKVTKILSKFITSGGYLADNNNSRIYQNGTVQSYVPITMDVYYSPNPIHPIWEVPRILGMEQYIEQLQSIIIPYLKLESNREKLESKGNEYQIKPYILLTGPTGCGKRTIVKSLCRCLNLHFFQVNCHNLSGDLPGATEARFKTTFDKAIMCAPCILLLRNIEIIRKDEDSIDDNDPKLLNSFIDNLKKLNLSSVILIGTTSNPQKLNTKIFSLMLHHVNIDVPSESERKLLMSALFNTVPISKDVSFSNISQHTAGFVLGDMIILLEKTLMIAYNRIKDILEQQNITWYEEIDISFSGIYILQEDILSALEELQASHSYSIGVPKIPNIYWEDIGGLADVKQEILDTIQLPLLHPELLAAGLRRSGVLLYGPPGTGKTLLAKAVATECALNFLSVKGPELINMYIGQSEENVRKVFKQARAATPCIIFFDELDSLAPNRGQSGDSGGVMDRVVSQLLAELDGLNKSAEVFVIGATNRPDLLDSALLRPGRFDRLVYVGIPSDHSSRVKILNALTRKMSLGKDVDLEHIAAGSPLNMTGADFYALTSNAMMNSIRRNIQKLEAGESEADVSLVVEMEDFSSALENVVPSVSDEELRRFDDIKQSLT